MALQIKEKNREITLEHTEGMMASKLRENTERPMFTDPESMPNSQKTQPLFNSQNLKENRESAYPHQALVLLNSQDSCLSS